MAWTAENIKLLKSEWGRGLSAAEIAKIMGGMSRNAIIGKAHRLGLTERRQAKRAPRRPGDVEADMRRQIAVEPARIDGAPVTVETIRAGLCRWPLGDPASEEFHFCGQASGERTYCAYHSRLAYGAAPSREGRAAMIAQGGACAAKAKSG